MRRSRKEQRPAAIFAGELLAGCDELFAVYPHTRDMLILPITIPIGADGLVLLQPQGPLDAPRVPATMAVFRGGLRTYGIRIERVDGGPMRFPGINDAAPLHTISVAITPTGLDITRDLEPLSFDEDTARALATALLITVNMKIAKSGNR